ncbi:hypothetical protein ABW19_dt0207788 [Dactylella cylindrospora]|nr:hypothetical protein ABW19_dt0207788 [Dactylella cylindrospora]
MDSSEQFFFSLLKISAAQMLRHAGLAGSRPSVLDAVTDMTARYLVLLGETAKTITESSNRTHSELSDVLSAMEHVGLLKPLTIFNPDLDDTRAIDNFITWAKSPEIEELRKIAGVVTVEVDETEEDAEVEGVPDATQLAAIATKAPEKAQDSETDIPIKRENEDDQPTPMMMDIDGVPLLEDSAQTPGPNRSSSLDPSKPATSRSNLLGTSGLGTSVYPSNRASATRDTEPPPDGEMENAKAKVKIKQVDWFTALRMKEDAARLKGTVLGKHAETKNLVVEGGDSVPVQL